MSYSVIDDLVRLPPTGDMVIGRPCLLIRPSFNCSLRYLSCFLEKLQSDFHECFTDVQHQRLISSLTIQGSRSNRRDCEIARKM